ncbi:EAL domain-containing protein [Granulosicoccaceae sp. 1_MG-2023]|nr:EAL domain-containing protein [Granulosicoccaceae sp. 1_MG-2023]
MRKRGYTDKGYVPDVRGLGSMSLPGAAGLGFRAPVSLRRRIMALALAGVTVFLLYLVLVVSQSSHNAETLNEIRDIRYPVQAQLLEAKHQLDVIQLELESSVFSVDENAYVLSAMRSEDFRQSLFEIQRLDPAIAPAIEAILEKFNAFYEESSATARQLRRDGANHLDVEFIALQSSQNYSEVADALQVLLDQQTGGLADSIGDAEQYYLYSVWLAYAGGLTGAVLFIFLTWYTANRIVGRINEMVVALRNIARGDNDMSVRIDISGNDEMSALAHWFNTFIGRLELVTEQSNLEIRKIAYTDNLSGLPNRRLLMECIEAEQERTALEPERALVGMFLDLDNFKPINDQLGHDAGDELIRQVAVRLTELVCGESVDSAMEIEALLAGQSPIVARIGGDEFFLLLPGMRTVEEAQLLAESVLKTILRPYEIMNEFCHIGVSIGISLLPRDKACGMSIMDMADMAMYEAKNSGKNTYRFFSQEITDSAKRKARLENALRQSVSRDELKLLYQPKVIIETGEYLGAEALLRWQSKEFGDLSPGRFIHLAEKSGYVLKLDEWVLNEACRQAQLWIQDHVSFERLAVNVSANLLRSVQCLPVVEAALRRYGVPAERIELELAESATTGEHIEEISNNLSRLRERGVRIALDDFGVGQSSMRLLISRRIDALKLDRDLVNTLVDDARSREVVRSLLSLADSLGIETVAEGVESEEHIAILRELGCKVAQGWYYAKPVNGKAMTALLDEHGFGEPEPDLRNVS